jgi:hypothetical protein
LVFLDRGSDLLKARSCIHHDLKNTSSGEHTKGSVSHQVTKIGGSLVIGLKLPPRRRNVKDSAHTVSGFANAGHVTDTPVTARGSRSRHQEGKKTGDCPFDFQGGSIAGPAALQEPIRQILRAAKSV